MIFASSSRMVLNAIASSSTGRAAAPLLHLPSSPVLARPISLSSPSLLQNRNTERPPPPSQPPSPSPPPKPAPSPPLFPPNYFSSLDNTDTGFCDLLAKVQSISSNDLSLVLEGPEGQARHRFLVNTLTHASHFDHALARANFFLSMDRRLYPRPLDDVTEAEMAQAREHVATGVYAEQDEGLTTREEWDRRSAENIEVDYRKMIEEKGGVEANRRRQRWRGKEKKERRKFLARLAVKAELEGTRKKGDGERKKEEVSPEM